MISHNTVLVLGAGASAPYGLPLGRDLVKEIIEGIGTDKLLFKHVRANYPKQWRTFIDRLVYSDCDSIDAFLEKEENQDLMGIGKDSIAAGILPKENVSNLFQYHRREPGKSGDTILISQQVHCFDPILVRRRCDSNLQPACPSTSLAGVRRSWIVI